MGIGPDAARRLTLWEFTALKTEWNARHGAEDDVAAPDPATVKRRLAALQGGALTKPRSA